MNTQLYRIYKVFDWIQTRGLEKYRQNDEIQVIKLINIISFALGFLLLIAGSFYLQHNTVHGLLLMETGVIFLIGHFLKWHLVLKWYIVFFINIGLIQEVLFQGFVVPGVYLGIVINHVCISMLVTIIIDVRKYPKTYYFTILYLLLMIWLGDYLYLFLSEVKPDINYLSSNLFQYKVIPSMGVFILVLTINYYKHIAQKYEQKLQQKILKNETIYKTIAYNFPNGMILILDHELKIEFLSGKNLKYQSHTINLAATSLSELFKFNNYDTIDRIFKSTLTLGEQHFELNIDEHMFWFALTPFKSPDNNQDKILTIIMNISQRTEMEKKLEDTKVLLDEARKIVQFGNWTWNIITDEFSVSENILEIFNLKQGELARIEDYYNLFISDENKIISTMLSIEVNNEYEKSWESKAVRQNEMYYFSTTAKMSRNASQELIISASITDITEKKRIERNLRKVEDRWKYAIENSNQNIWDYNVFTGMIQIFNPEFMENNDNKEFKIIKFSEWLSFIHPDDGKIINDAMKQYLADDSPEFEKEYRIKDVDGNYMWMLGKGKVVEWDELGKPFRVVGTQMDITDKKIAQIELTNYKDHLEQLVALRTRELQQTNEELEEFTYSITHDLRAPLKAIAGFNDILKEEYYQKNEESNKVWSIIDRNLKYTDQLISDLLSFSKVRNHDLNIQKVDTGQLIKEIIEALSYDHDLEKYSFRVDPLPPIRVDYTLFKQVFMNLISNAIKFSRSKTSPTITIGHFQKQSKTIIFVKDNGVGFNMNYIDRLFKMFKRLHGDDEFEGTGIGLSIVKRIVEIHDGEVWAESTVNNGATFFISL